MERRNRSIKALKELQYIDSLDSQLRAKRIKYWCEKYLSKGSISEFDLELTQLNQLSELFYKNIDFLKQYVSQIKGDLNSLDKVRQFLR
jgi:uncharacterized protein VirK/YbjX